MVFFTNVLLPFLLLAVLSPTPALSYINPAARIWPADATDTSSSRTYIVLVQPPPSNASEDVHRRWHESFLPSTLTGGSSETRLLHSYTEVFSGFAARLTEAEVDAVAKKPGFVRAFPDRKLQLATTHTSEFLGLKKGTGIWSSADYGKGVIIGLLDSGIYAAHPSFDDHGVPPPPARWKGSCSASRCNNKLIGAKSFVGGDSGDTVGHGTHTSSTAAGNFVTGASYKGVGAGTAAGIAPAAHIAMYKVCSDENCDSSAILAGLDEAVKDGVDVVSVSLGGDARISFEQDPLALGAFRAVSKGITVVCAAGNNGPTPISVTNDSPWVLTVAAGSMDRSFAASVYLGNGRRINGEALNQLAAKTSSPKRYPLLYSEVEHSCQFAGDFGSVPGKIVVCLATNTREQVSQIQSVMDAGAAGVILYNLGDIGYTTIVRDYNSSVVQVTSADGAVLMDYATSSKNNTAPSASVTYNNTLLGARPAPVVAFFSSRGPSALAPGILKPDVLAPGLNVLAAWPPKTTDSASSGPFNVISGTSMATPHVSGVVALLKSLHPDWSPAAIKSAILTTSDAVDNAGGPILDEQHGKANACARGAGHVNPAKAADPGLVYDITADEFAGYICWLQTTHANATSTPLDSSLPCATLPKITTEQLNYPTITVPLRPTTFTVNRTVTNVGPAESTYTAKVEAPSTLTVHVSPETLSFSKAGEKKTFSVSVSGHGVTGQDLIAEGSLSWVSEKHVVRSPIVAVVRVGNPPPASSPPGKTSTQH
ncbi:subtilisin-like protease [Lolium rigidum]|uniref:subtilisin-like protease n=1 Tax=Lolium rigidum TaxID=89674 RepID=UPI001F5E2956|nr:subtilisin-like protease [Lolium rigidum]